MRKGTLRRRVRVRVRVCVRQLSCYLLYVECWAKQSSVVDRSGNISNKMKVLVAVLALAAAVSARPGGYTSNGGVYFNPDVHLDYMDHARNAGKLRLFNS